MAVADPDGACPHEDFEAVVSVTRLTDAEGGPVTGFSAEVTVQCAAEGCAEPFVFVGAPTGYSPRQPMTSFDGRTLRAPIRPANAPEGWGERGPAVGLRFVEPGTGS